MKANPTEPIPAEAIQRLHSGAPWESQVGYCRAVRVGNFITVSGTAPIDEQGQTYAPGDAYAQARRCLELIQQILEKMDSGCDRVIRTRMFVTDISRWAEYGKAHGEFFAAHPPATSMVEVKALIDPEMLIEIEAEAFVTLPD
ncbi:MAG: RidA family protein [Cyanobacteria bacterium P01_A01_bin.123]